MRYSPVGHAWMVAGGTIVALIIIIIIIIMAAVLTAHTVSHDETSYIREGVRVTTPEGKIGMVTEASGGSDKIRVRFLMRGVCGEQYQEVVFFRKELRRVAEREDTKP